MLDYFWLIPLPILATLIITLIFGNRLGLKSAFLGILGTGSSFVMSLMVLPAVIAGERCSLVFPWIPGVNLGFMLDPLTLIMLLLVSFLSTLIILYAYGYMRGEDGLMRFFAEVQLFAFSMLSIVIADNILQAFIFWELIGLCSYLLIGFWFHKPAAAAAAKKAFLTTRVGDVIMLIGILILFTQVGSFRYEDFFAAMGSMDPFWLTLATLCIFGGVVGKSAQFPLHVWLPDAMEGPTPVSALIHAATLVKAGIYLTARLLPLFALCSVTQETMMIIGAITALGTALMALVADDFKRVLAFSTLSQLGFMVVALGSMNYVAAIFHLVNHAFFKALLFLGAGSAIHGAGTGNIWKIGGLFKHQKITALTILAATISISGIPPFSGFWSKDEILISAFHHSSILGIVMMLASFLTAFYMFRLYYLVFTGHKRSDYSGHESCWPMVLPLVILSFFAIFSGFARQGISFFLTGKLLHHGSNTIMIASIIVAVLGVLAATCVYYWRIVDADKIAAKCRPLFNLLYHRYYIDELYLGFCNIVVLGLAKACQWIDTYLIDGIIHLIRDCTLLLSRMAKFSDTRVVDGLVNGLCSGIFFSGKALRRTSTGYAQQYLIAAALGITVLIFLVIGGVI